MRSLFRLAVLTCCTVLSQSFASAQGSVEVEIKRNATVRSDGHTLFVHVKVACDTTADVLEALVTVEQPGAFGEGFLSLVECDGRQHGYLVKVQSFDGTFHAGEAQASALILICDEQDNCIDGQASRVVNIRGSRHTALTKHGR